MGATGSSSKRKSSSSSLKKNKRLKTQVRKKKRSRRNKSKKLRRRDDSVSYSNDDDSRILVSVSSSSFDEDYRSRKARSRSRTRRDVKGSKKRARRNSASHDTIQESSRVKKRKGSKKNGDSDVRKKSQKKKPRKDVSISSMSSDTWSCSTGRGGGSSGEESEFERTRGRSIGKEKDKKNSSKVKRGSKKSRYRSRSCTSCSRCSKSSNHRSEERLTGENNSRRLRSVITVTKEAEENEGRELDKDEHKEEIIYDHDDYPSCRSNDSNDGGSKRESARSLHVAAEKKRQVENVKEEEAVVSNIRTTELKESDKDGGGQCEGSNPTFDGVGANNPLKENKIEVSAAVGSQNGDDLESILRQRALENLRKFRGGLQTNARILADQKERSDSELKQSSTAKAESVQIKFHKEDGGRVVSAIQVADQGSMRTIGRESASSSQNDGKISDGQYSGIESRATKQDVVHPPDQVAIAGNLKEKVNTTVGAVPNKSKLGTSALRREYSGTYTTLKQAPTSQASPKAKLLVTKSTVDKSVVETSQTVAQSSNNHGVKVNNACGSAAPEPSSCLKPTSGEHSSKELQNEGKEGSQFEQKTMSVMRGGEMVQVSYKVYIPKKVPALARRQLQR